MIFKVPERYRFRNYRLSTKLIITYIILTVIPMMLLGYISFVQYNRSIQEQIGEYMPRFLQQANANIEKHIEEFMALPELLLNSDSAVAVLRRDSYQSQSDLNFDQYTLSNYLTRTYLNGSNSDVLGVFVLSKNRLFYSSRMEFTGLDWVKNANPYGQDLDLRGKAKIILPSETHLKFEGDIPYILITKQMNDFDNRKNLGTMFIAVQLTFIDSILRDFEKNEKADLWVMNRQGEIIYHTDRDKIGTIDPDIKRYPILNGSFLAEGSGDSRLVSVTESSSFGGVIAHSIPLKYLTERTDLAKQVTIVVFIVMVVVTSIFSVLFALRVTRPIKKLSQLMKEVEMGKFQVNLKIQSTDEVGMLARSFNSMIATIRELIEKNYDIKIRQKEAELYALQSQINPHFMYNTLETINMAVENGETDTVVQMVTQLGRMLRFSVSNKFRIVRIEEELQHVTDYLMIQKFRFEDRLTFDIDRRTETGDLYTPKFILQPIVENSIKYGMESRQALHIEIMISKEFSARSGESDIVLRIRDNGPGIAAERLGELEQSLRSGTLAGKDSEFGLSNVNDRIAMMLGADYGIQLHSIEGKGTEVTVRISMIDLNEKMRLEQTKDEGT
ncbi:sensor histidine kinase [Paenibacillus mendelii]|uniref:Sensor histidine kinase n=1 Tax=Paenibacillus mendelii TaxID=206163 RepID=A0ABV6J3A1_9BACL|nr:sensor histidine kinase [Paenibacillus mendelii]MCQ6559450.1 sensor histidine kinase [Paenibacillus mendelii]